MRIGKNYYTFGNTTTYQQPQKHEFGKNTDNSTTIKFRSRRTLYCDSIYTGSSELTVLSTSLVGSDKQNPESDYQAQR